MDMTITFIGFLAAICTTISFLPQAIKTIRSKRTKDISLPAYLILTAGVLLWTVYGFYTKDNPVFLANAVTLFFVLPILLAKIKHG